MQRCSEENSPSDRRARTGTTRDAQAARIRETSPQEWLQRTIETEIVPRLMLAHRMPEQHAPDRAASSPCGSAETERFTTLVLAEDSEACEAFVRALRERGAGLEDIYLDLLAPTARRLGLMWETDQYDFAQVTLGLWRLQNLVFDLSPLLPAPWTERPDGPRRAMLAAAPGCQHTLGLLMVSEFFRRAGWDVWTEPTAAAQDLVSTARDGWFDVIGLSIGGEKQVPSLAAMVTTLRRASQNPSVGMMVGGPILLLQPELLGAIGADFTAPDARVAVEAAEAFVAALGRPA